MALVFEVPLLKMDQPIGSPELHIPAHDGELAITFVVPRDIAVRQLPFGTTALSATLAAWEQAIEAACRRAYARCRPPPDEPVPVDPRDFPARVARAHHA